MPDWADGADLRTHPFWYGVYDFPRVISLVSGHFVKVMPTDFVDWGSCEAKKNKRVRQPCDDRDRDQHVLADEVINHMPRTTAQKIADAHHDVNWLIQAAKRQGLCQPSRRDPQERSYWIEKEQLWMTTEDLRKRLILRIV